MLSAPHAAAPRPAACAQDFTSGVVEGKPYVAQWHRDELAAAGKKLSFAEVSEAVKYDMLGDSPVASVIRNRKQMFVPDVKAVLNSDRSKIAEEYMIESAAFVPVLGGVIEFGSSISRPWASDEQALQQIMPNEEIEKALRSGATYMMYWERDNEAATYTQKATFEVPKNRLTLKANVDKSFISECADVVLDANGLGPVGQCGRAAATVVVPNTATQPNFKRRELAQEWGVGKVPITHLPPLLPPVASPRVPMCPRRTAASPTPCRGVQSMSNRCSRLTPNRPCAADHVRPAGEWSARVWHGHQRQERDDIRFRVPGSDAAVPPHRLHAQGVGGPPLD